MLTSFNVLYRNRNHKLIDKQTLKQVEDFAHNKSVQLKPGQTDLTIDIHSLTPSINNSFIKFKDGKETVVLTPQHPNIGLDRTIRHVKQWNDKSSFNNVDNPAIIEEKITNKGKIIPIYNQSQVTDNCNNESTKTYQSVDTVRESDTKQVKKHKTYKRPTDPKQVYKNYRRNMRRTVGNLNKVFNMSNDDTVACTLTFASEVSKTKAIDYLRKFNSKQSQIIAEHVLSTYPLTEIVKTVLVNYPYYLNKGAKTLQSLATTSVGCADSSLTLKEMIKELLINNTIIFHNVEYNGTNYHTHTSIRLKGFNIQPCAIAWDKKNGFYQKEKKQPHNTYEYFLLKYKHNQGEGHAFQTKNKAYLTTLNNVQNYGIMNACYNHSKTTDYNNFLKLITNHTLMTNCEINFNMLEPLLNDYDIVLDNVINTNIITKDNHVIEDTIVTIKLKLNHDKYLFNHRQLTYYGYLTDFKGSTTPLP